MKPGNGEVLVVLDTHPEIEAVEAGIANGGLIDDLFEAQVFNSRRQLREDVFGYDLIDTPALSITEENVENTRASLQATIALRSLNGLRAALHGQKRTARKILQAISQ